MGRVRSLDPTPAALRAREWRVEQTDAEAKLWAVLRNRALGGWKWRRQAAHAPYILDFYCAEARLVVEVDGGQHADRAACDARRTEFLERSGLRVLRFGNVEVLTNRDGVCLTILRACAGERGSG